MKLWMSGAALIGALTLGSAVQAADYAVIHLETVVDAPIDKTWAKVGGYCAIELWRKATAPCVMSAGTGEVGSVRKLRPDGSIVEIMVAKTDHSYTYTQPASTILYHGTLAAEPLPGGKTKLLYTLLYDQAPDGTPEAMAKDRASRTTNFTDGLATMKAMAEAK